MRRQYYAEFFGTFILVLVGTGAIVINDVSGGAISHVGIAISFGLVVMAMIHTLGEISGAHINPAVTIAFWLVKRFEGRYVLPYVSSQLAGALAASATMLMLFPDHQTLPRIFAQAKELGQSTSSIADKLARERFMGHAMEQTDAA